MLLEPRDAQGSPWRFKVTVQAEQMSGNTKRDDKSHQPTDNLENSHIPDLCPVSQLSHHASTDYSLSEIEIPDDVAQQPFESHEAIDSRSLESFKSSAEKVPSSVRSRTSVRSAPRSTPAHVTRQTEPSHVEMPQFVHEEEGEAVLGAHAPGDATMLESEEFSMISVDSLPSRMTGHSSPSQPVQTTEDHAPANRSYMPSSPPAFVADRITPVPEDSTPQDPQAPHFVHPIEANITTPMRESARKSGRALQDALNGPFRESVSRELPAARESIFAGFSSGTRRQLRQSLHTGQGLAIQSFDVPVMHNAPRLAPAANGFPNYLSPFQSPVRQSTGFEVQDSRLLTPDTENRSPQSRSNSRQASQTPGNVEYPHIGSGPQSLPKDGMSWIVTHPQELTAPTTQTKSPPQSSAVPEQRSSAPADTQEEDDRDIWQEEASRSLIDDQGSPQQTDLFLEDLPVKPRRSKLPGTWRRTSDAPFTYSDSPDHEQRQNRKISASTTGSRKSSGVITPPSSEDGRDSMQKAPAKQPEQEALNNSEFEEIERVNTPTEVMSQISEQDSVASGDDTGLFWQVNMPAVYNKGKRSAAVKSSFAPSSPLRNTFLEASPVKSAQNHDSSSQRSVAGRVSTNTASSSAVIPSPLRRSLLKSSKVPGGPVAREVEDALEKGTMSVEHDLSETQTDSSLASDAQQLQREMRRQTSGGASTISSLNSGRQLGGSKRHTSGSTIDLTVSSVSGREDSVRSSEDDFSSYQEELNLDSPMRIKVNFNDSEGNSTLLEPKRHYPPLFGNAPTFSKPNTSTPESPQPRSPIAKLTESFWEAVTRPPIYASPERKPSLVVEPIVPNSVPDDVLRLRRKYGLLPDTHPFTYAHIRTLHRMLNSTRSRPSNSIIPRSGPLNHDLSRLLGKMKTNELDQRFIWTQPYLHVVNSFMSLLLPQQERERLEAETGIWGDAEAIRHRGRDSKGRFGQEVVFSGVKGGVIEAEWVKDVLVDIVFKEEMNVKKKKVAEMMARAEKMEKTRG